MNILLLDLEADKDMHSFIINKLVHLDTNRNPTCVRHLEITKKV